jgi:hypothetical protein
MKVGVGCGGVGGVFLKQSSQQPSLTVRWISSLDREQYFDTEVQLAKWFQNSSPQGFLIN